MTTQVPDTVSTRTSLTAVGHMTTAVQAALAHGITDLAELNVSRDGRELYAFANELRDRLDACRHEPGQDRDRRSRIANALDLATAVMRGDM